MIWNNASGSVFVSSEAGKSGKSMILSKSELAVLVALALLAFFYPSMAWFLVVMFGLGFAITRKADVMTLGFGLSAFLVLSMAFNFLSIPLNALLFLAIAAVIIVYFYHKGELSLDISVSALDKNKFLIAFFLINIYVFWAGANAYPYIEDGDSWIHATGVKWVKMTQSFSTFYTAENFRRLYIEPYPPGYDVLLGVIHQLTDSVVDTMNFYNVFLIGLGLFFAFYCFEEFMKDRKMALLATFFLLILPSYMSHFIWAQTLAMILIFVAFYGMEKGIKDKKYFTGAALAIGGIAVTQPSTAPIFVFLAGIYLVSKVLAEGTAVIKPVVAMGLLGLLFAMIYWVPITLKYGVDLTSQGIGITPTKFTSATEDTSGGVVYSANDFLFPPSASKIDQQIGIGLVISALALIGLFLALESTLKGKWETWLVFAVISLVFCFLGTEGNALPVKLFPHRFWVYLSIPVALLATHGFFETAKMIGEEKKKLFTIAVVLLAVYTSAVPKFIVQTAQWPPGPEFTSTDELVGYVQMKNTLPPETLVFPVCSLDDKVIGSDMLAEAYIEEYDTFKRNVADKSASDVYNFLKGRGYSYLTFDSTCLQELGAEKTQQLVTEYSLSELYTEEFSNPGFLLLKLK